MLSPACPFMSLSLLFPLFKFRHYTVPSPHWHCYRPAGKVKPSGLSPVQLRNLVDSALVHVCDANPKDFSKFLRIHFRLAAVTPLIIHWP